jgi:hypothetical protein
MNIYQILMTKYYRLLTNEYQISTNSYVRIYKLFMQNKPNLRNDKMNINIDMASNYGNLYRCLRPKNKANSNPIKPKTNPIKANSNPIQTQLCHYLSAKSETFVYNRSSKKPVHYSCEDVTLRISRKFISKEVLQ